MNAEEQAQEEQEEQAREEASSDRHMRRVVEAMVAVNPELGERYGEELARSFVERLHTVIDQRIEARLGMPGSRPYSLLLPLVSLVIGLLGMAIIGVTGGPFVSFGTILSPWIPIVAINIIYAIRTSN